MFEEVAPGSSNEWQEFLKLLKGKTPAPRRTPSAHDKSIFLSLTVGRKCLCNGLFGTLGLGQVSADGRTEPPIVTCGDDMACLAVIIKRTASRTDAYSAADVLDYLLSAKCTESTSRQTADALEGVLE